MEEETAAILASKFEVEQTVEFLFTQSFKRVALQFPDDLLPESAEVVKLLRHAYSQRLAAAVADAPQPAEALVVTSSGSDGGQVVASAQGALELYILMDTTYGHCCVDEVAADHVAAECVIHYGHACLSRPSRLPAKFVFGHSPLDVKDCARQIGQLAEQLQAPLIVLYGLDYVHAVPALQQELQLRQQAGTEAGADSPCPDLDVPVSGTRGSTGASGPQRTLQFAQLCSLEGPGPGGLGCGREDAGAGAGAGPGAGTGSGPVERSSGGADGAVEGRGGGQGDSQSASTGEAGAGAGAGVGEGAGDLQSGSRGEDARGGGGGLRGQQAGQGEGPEVSGGGVVEELGGLRWQMPCGATAVHFLWLGEEGPALTNLLLTHNAHPVHRYDPGDRSVHQGLQGHSRVLQRRYFLVEKAKDAAVVGIVVGTLGVAGFLEALKSLRRMVAAAGKKSYTFVMGRPTPTKLANFPEVGVFVLLACEQTALLDSKDYMVPVITPFEATLAFERGRVWTGEYEMGFRSLVAENRPVNGDSVPTNQEGNGVRNKAAQAGRDNEDSEEEEPRFSFISGGYVSGPTSKDATACHEEKSQALALQMSKALAMKQQLGLSPSAGPSSVQSGGEYLLLRRSWQGLETPPHMDGSQVKLPPSVVHEGQVGRAATYTHEHGTV